MSIKQFVFLSILIIIPLSNNEVSKFKMIKIESVTNTYIKTWGIIRHYLEDDNSLCKDIDSLTPIQLQKIIQKPSRKTLNKNINQLLSYYKLTPCLDDNYFYGFSLKGYSLTNISHLNKKNRRLIVALLKSIKSDSTCGLTQRDGNENILFDHKKYRTKLKTSPENRLFSLAIYWNIINLYYPFKDYADVNWNQVLDIYIPIIMQCESELEFHMAMLELASTTNDGHSRIESSEISDYWGYFNIPIHVEFFREGLYISDLQINSPETSNLRIGDQLVTINNISFDSFVAKNLKYVSGPDHDAKMRNLAQRFLYRRTADPVSILVQRNQTKITNTVTPIHDSDYSSEFFSYSQKHKAFTVFDDSIAYLDLSEINPSELGDYYSKFEKLPAIIIDLRKYPSDILDSLANYFFDRNRQISEWWSPDLSHPGEFRLGDVSTIGRDNSVYYQGTIGLLVNHGTFSMGEFTAMAMQSLPNTITIGQETSGTDGDVSKFRLPGRIRATFTCLKILYPNGDNPYRDGLKIDCKFDPKPELLKTESDPELSFAIDVLKNQWR
jgi:carboxyl-terminal processing protease